MSRPAFGPSEPPIQWVLESVSGRERDVDSSLSFLVPRQRMSGAIPLFPVFALVV